VKKTPREMGTAELVYGVHPVRELLAQKKRRVYDIFTLSDDPKSWAEIQNFLPKYPYSMHRLSRQALSERIGTTDHQGVAALAEPFSYRKKFFDVARDQFLVMLDGIQDARNLGAIIRSAYCTGADGVILIQKQGVSLNAAALKASAGLAERMSIYQATTPSVALMDLKHAGYNIYVAALSDTPNAFTVEYKKPLCLVIGSEGLGVSQQSLKAGTVVTLPQKSPDVSYNASVAAGIIMSIVSNSFTK
jgi:23S rRNA (guanosine2251-2'-O)-methyltransferase